jgi:hypothetical protein
MDAGVLATEKGADWSHWTGIVTREVDKKDWKRLRKRIAP